MFSNVFKKNKNFGLIVFINLVFIKKKVCIRLQYVLHNPHSQQWHKADYIILGIKVNVRRKKCSSGTARQFVPFDEEMSERIIDSVL